MHKIRRLAVYDVPVSLPWRLPPPATTACPRLIAGTFPFISGDGTNAYATARPRLLRVMLPGPALLILRPRRQISLVISVEQIWIDTLPDS